MTRSTTSWPRRFVRWLFGAPFRELPPAYGNTVPPELRRFEAEAEEASRHSLGQVAAQAPTHHAHVQPARQDESLERQ